MRRGGGDGGGGRDAAQCGRHGGGGAPAWVRGEGGDPHEGGGHPQKSESGAEGGARVENPTTIATAIKIGNPASWEGAVRARDESGGSIGMVTDDEIVAAYRLLAETEGVFVEPASAAGIAGLLKLGAKGELRGVG